MAAVAAYRNYKSREPLLQAPKQDDAYDFWRFRQIYCFFFFFWLNYSCEANEAQQKVKYHGHEPLVKNVLLYGNGNL